MVGSFRRSILVQATVVLTILVVLSLGTVVVYHKLKSSSDDRLAQKRSGLLLISYSAGMLISLSIILLRMGYEISSTILNSTSWIKDGYLVLYFIIVISAYILAPLAIATPEIAEKRNEETKSWLPRLGVIQSITLGAGIVWGT